MERKKFVVAKKVVKARVECFKRDNEALYDYIADNLHPYASDERQQIGYDECLAQLFNLLDVMKKIHICMKLGCEKQADYICDSVFGKMYYCRKHIRANEGSVGIVNVQKIS